MSPLGVGTKRTNRLERLDTPKGVAGGALFGRGRRVRKVNITQLKSGRLSLGGS